MKNTPRLALIALLALTASSASADTYWFDGTINNVAGNGNGVSAGVSGTWNTTLTNWDRGAALSHVAWPNLSTDTAVFGDGLPASNTKTVTIPAAVTIIAGTINPLNTGWVFTGGTLDLDVFDAGTVITSTRISSLLTGTIQFKSGVGNTGALNTSAIAQIDGNNTGLTATEIAFAVDGNTLIINNAGALGNASASLNVSKGVVNLGTTAGSPISYNAWATDLASTLRGRFDTSTWNGAITLTGNAQLMSRNAAGVKLILSSSATIDLNANTVSLWAGSTSAGIELNGVISGSGNLITGNGLGALGGADNALGTTSLGAANTFTGTATTSQNLGTLALNHVDALQSATLNTGDAGSQSVTFTVVGTNTYNIGAVTGSDDLAIGGNTISVGTKAGTSSFSAKISGIGGAVTKVGNTSTWILSGAHEYTGATTVQAGVLAVDGSLNIASAVTVGGATATGSPTLSGSGTVYGSVSIAAASGGAAGRVNPSSVGGIGNLTVGSTIIAGTLTIDINAASSDKLVVNGDLNISNATLALNTLSAPAMPSYELASYTGTLTGANFATTSGLPTGYEVTFDNTNKKIMLTATAGYGAWAAQYASSQTAELDYDQDGVKNGVEYFMGETSIGFTASPTPDNTGKVVWPKDTAFAGTWTVETSPDLVDWTPVSATDNGTSIEYILPSGSPALFVHLIVTPD